MVASRRRSSSGPTSRSIVGLDTRDPRVPLERTEFVRADSSYSILARIVRATQIDTILHTHLIVDSTRATGRTLHEINVIGTMNLLAAAGAPGSPVRKVVREELGARLRRATSRTRTSSARTCTRTRAPRTDVERSLLEVEAFLRDFADDNPHVDVTLLRFANVLGDDIDTPFAHALQRPVVPEIFGFDPRVQFVHEDDVVGALMYATTQRRARRLQRRRRRQPAVERGVRDRRQAGASRCRRCSPRGPPSRCGSSASGICRPRR